MFPLGYLPPGYFPPGYTPDGTTPLPVPPPVLYAGGAGLFDVYPFVIQGEEYEQAGLLSIGEIMTDVRALLLSARKLQVGTNVTVTASQMLRVVLTTSEIPPGVAAAPFRSATLTATYPFTTDGALLYNTLEGPTVGGQTIMSAYDEADLLLVTVPIL